MSMIDMRSQKCEECGRPATIATQDVQDVPACATEWQEFTPLNIWHYYCDEHEPVEEPKEETQRKQQDFLILVMETCKTGDKTKLAEWWREHFPGYKFWLIGPDCIGDER